jgi:hypothetical protein
LTLPPTIEDEIINAIKSNPIKYLGVTPVGYEIIERPSRNGVKSLNSTILVTLAEGDAYKMANTKESKVLSRQLRISPACSHYHLRDHSINYCTWRDVIKEALDGVEPNDGYSFSRDRVIKRMPSRK